MSHIKFNFLYLQNIPIFDQLQLEEALLKADDRNWVIVNEGSSKAIVLGISGHPEKLVDLKRLAEKPIPLIRRFSGGGTVIVDENTHFVTFIGNGGDLEVPCNSQAILEWTKGMYSTIFNSIDFQIKENDYAIGIKKFGGNAQYLRKNRWLHHTSLLWDYDLENMNYLLMPQKTPQYRESRTHGEFLCSLKDYLPYRGTITDNILKWFQLNFNVEKTTFQEAKEILKISHRQSTFFI